MGSAPFNIKMGQSITTDAPKVEVDESFIAHFQVREVNAVAANDTAVLVATALTASTQTIKTNITNPAVPRNIEVAGNATGIVGDAVIKGTNYADEAITENITLNGTTVVEGNKAFKTVIEIDLPIQTHAGTDTVSIGFGEKLGLPYKLAHNTVLCAYLDNIKESTPPTVTIDPIALENNTVDLNSNLNGKVVDIYLIV